MTTPVIPDEAVIAVVDIALFGCEDGEMLSDDDCSIPVGEFRRLLHDVAKPRVTALLAANAPRVIRTAADIRALGEAVRDGTGEMPAVLLIEDWAEVPITWNVVCARHGNGVTWMHGPGCNWITDLVTDDGIAGHGPWRVVWSRGVEL